MRDAINHAVGKFLVNLFIILSVIGGVGGLIFGLLGLIQWAEHRYGEFGGAAIFGAAIIIIAAVIATTVQMEEEK